MACTYCFYLEKKKLFTNSKIHRMTEDILADTAPKKRKASPRKKKEAPINLKDLESNLADDF